MNDEEGNGTGGAGGGKVDTEQGFVLHTPLEWREAERAREMQSEREAALAGDVSDPPYRCLLSCVW
jgi:hypothetical protein